MVNEKISTRYMYDREIFFSLSQLEDVPCLSHEFVLQPTQEARWLILAKTLTCGIGDCAGAEFILTRYYGLQSLDHLE
jgi:hypothetical protein